VEGAEGKIKGGGVTPMLTHCLHIVFRNSTPKGLGVTVFAQTPIGLEDLGVSPFTGPTHSLALSRIPRGENAKKLLEFQLVLGLFCVGAYGFKMRPNIVADFLKGHARNTRFGGISRPLCLANGVL